MAAYVTYAYYTGTYLGIAIAEADFPRLALRASETIDAMTNGRAAGETDENTVDLIRRATCAVAETLQQLEQSGGVVQSERVGNYSVSYGGGVTAQKMLQNAAKRYLGLTGLMFAGVCE